jgi:hypothetical protein
MLTTSGISATVGTPATLERTAKNNRTEHQEHHK